MRDLPAPIHTIRLQQTTHNSKESTTIVLQLWVYGLNRKTANNQISYHKEEKLHNVVIIIMGKMVGE